MNDAALAWRVEQACFNAWPALNEVHIGDWVARFGAGLHRRTNSANPLGPRTRRPAAVIEQAEAAYGRWGLPATFRVPTIIEPEMDTQLDLMGYDVDGLTLTLVGDEVEAASDDAVELSPSPTPQWLAAKMAAYPPGQPTEVYPKVIERLAIPSVFAAYRLDGQIASLAYGAVHDRLFVVEGVVTAAEHRGKGLARRMLAAMFASELGRSADAVCLQVQADNHPAAALYRRLGLTTELYRYHYRRRVG